MLIALRALQMRSLCAEQLYLGLMELADVSVGNPDMEAEMEADELGGDELEELLLEVEWTAERPSRVGEDGGDANGVGVGSGSASGSGNGSGSGGVIQDVKRLLRARLLGRVVS